MLPSLIDAAVTALDIEGGDPGYALIDRDGSSREVTISVYVTGPRDSGYAEFDTDGRLLRSS
jgi:hypothetical protein